MEWLAYISYFLSLLAIGQVNSLKRKCKNLEAELLQVRHFPTAPGLEFKLLRISPKWDFFGEDFSFEDPSVMSRILAEEKEFGWSLVQVIDENTIQLSRHANDLILSNQKLGMTPAYRTTVEIPQELLKKGTRALFIKVAIISIGAVAMTSLLMYLWIRR
jgi:hypothetical protein